MNASLFPAQKLSKTEEDILLEVYRNPVVKKHLQILAMEDTKELLAFSAISKTDSEIGKALATVQGKLSVIQTLLSISEIQPPNKEQQS